ncbi:MAG TPA: PAS domain-containing protein, partial [Longimicrobiales bacterium]|nr:PAS domain-containing protein [Longimicrobiales bacterium]
DQRVANEELISMNEELQSSNEELQTAQEETQSINEELQTVNTELSQKMEQLKEAHADLDNLFRSTDIATIFLDGDLRIKRFTPPATDVFRLQEEDAGRRIGDITSRIVGDGPRLAEELHSVLDTLEPVEREIRAGDDHQWYVMRIFPYRTVEDVIDGVVLTFVDISDLKRLEHERTRLAAIVEGMHDAVVGHRPDGTITSWNEGAERLFGYEAGEAIGRDMSLIMPAEHDGEIESSVEQVLRGEWTKAEETVRRTRGGERLHVSVNLSPVRDETGRVVEISQTARDITGRILAERAVREGERRKDEFLAMLGHELRNPLGVIRNGIELLKQERIPGEEGGDADPIQVLDRQVRYLMDLVDDFTDVTRLTMGHFDLRLETMDLAELVRKTVADHRRRAEEAGVALEADLPGRRLAVEGDRTRLAQVLGNLIRNACSYTPEGGHVLVQAREERGSAVVSVQDDGPGLEAEDLERIFELFQRGPDAISADEDGLGLGLPVAKKLMALHEGSLEAASEGDGRGATFTFRIPLIDEGAPERGLPRTESAEAPERAPARRVLVVEDNLDAAHIFEQLLRIQGHEVTVAHDAASALDAVAEAPPDIVLCDINLRGEVDGYGLASALREIPELSGLRLVAVTGYGREADRIRALEAGFDAHLVKPVGADDLDRVLAY